MTEESNHHWRALIESEKAPLFAWRDAYELMLRMEALCTTDEAFRELIQRFGGSWSITYASALCGALVRYADESGHGARLKLLLEFFEVLRFRSHLPTMTTLLSKVNYLIQRDSLRVEEQKTLLELCLAALGMCEQMSPDDWSLGRADDIIEIVDLIAEHGLFPETQAGEQGVLLISLLERAKQMSSKIRGSKGKSPQ
jgi:hypothetical protein